MDYDVLPFKPKPPKTVDREQVLQAERRKRRDAWHNIEGQGVFLLPGNSGLDMSHLSILQRCNISSWILLGKIHILETVFLLRPGMEEDGYVPNLEFEIIRLIHEHGNPSTIVVKDCLLDMENQNVELLHDDEDDV